MRQRKVDRVDASTDRGNLPQRGFALNDDKRGV